MNVTTQPKVKLQKVFLRGADLSRERARAIQKAINDRLAGKAADVESILVPLQPAITKTSAPSAKSKKSGKPQVTVTYTSHSSRHRDYYVNHLFVGTARESNSSPGTFRFKLVGTETVEFSIPYEKRQPFKTFKAATTALETSLRKSVKFTKTTQDK